MAACQSLQECTGRSGSQGSLTLLQTSQDLGDEVDDGQGWLFRVHFCKQVTDVVCHAALLAGYEPKESNRDKAEDY